MEDDLTIPDFLDRTKPPEKAPTVPFRTEPTEQGLQFVIPGCEHNWTRGPKQRDLFK